MTYEERQQAICKECNPDDVGCAYRCRGMTCPRSDQMMDGWELGWQDAVDKACKFLWDCGYIDTLVIDEVIDNFKKYMEEQQ